MKKKPGKIDDGGPAFRATFDTMHRGMSLRDYFAAAMMPRVIDLSYPAQMEGLARNAYQFADIMLKVRKKEKP